MPQSGNSPEPRSLPTVPWSRAALAYALGVSMLEFAAILLSPALFRAVVVADAAMGWVVVIACWQGLRAVKDPPPVLSMLISSLATGHWLAAALAATGAICDLTQNQ